MPQLFQLRNFTVFARTPLSHEALHSMYLLTQRSAAIRHDLHINILWL